MQRLKHTHTNTHTHTPAGIGREGRHAGSQVDSQIDLKTDGQADRQKAITVPKLPVSVYFFQTSIKFSQKPTYCIQMHFECVPLCKLLWLGG